MEILRPPILLSLCAPGFPKKLKPCSHDTAGFSNLSCKEITFTPRVGKVAFYVLPYLRPVEVVQLALQVNPLPDCCIGLLLELIPELASPTRIKVIGL